jgi:DNA-binding NarL/FixJ family response regulator
MIRVLVVDDNSIVREGLVSVLAIDEGIKVAGTAGDGKAAIDLTGRLRPDLVLLDVRMPLVDGVTAAATLSRITRVLMLSYAEDGPTVQAAIRSGALGYLVHGSFTPEELCRSIRDAVSGTASPLSAAASLAVVEAVQNAPGTPLPGALGLSAREIEILDLMARGLTNDEISRLLFLAGKTVQNHINRIYTKLDVAHRSAAVARYLGLDGR